MNIRSVLFIPGDSEKKLSKADDFAADALVLDLEDSVAEARKPRAREMVREFLAARQGKRKSQLWIRINPLDHPDMLQDLVKTIGRSEEHTSELQSLMRISYAVFCLKK